MEAASLGVASFACERPILTASGSRLNTARVGGSPPQRGPMNGNGRAAALAISSSRRHSRLGGNGRKELAPILKLPTHQSLAEAIRDIQK